LASHLGRDSDMRRSPLAAATIAWILRRLKDIAEIGSDIRRTAIYRFTRW
jgi:hypothetical protein